MEKKTKIFLNYLSKDEKEKMTGAMPFLTHGGTNGKKDLLDMANDLYGGTDSWTRNGTTGTIRANIVATTATICTF